MYTRSRQGTQGFGTQQQRQPATPNSQGSFQNQQGQNQNSFSQQGNYQTSQSTPMTQQGNYKPANVQQFKGQPQQTTLQQQANQARMQQQVKNPQQQQQTQQQPQQQQQQPQQQQQQPQQQQQQLKQQQPAVGTPQTQRLKPILKQSPTTPVATPQATPPQPPQIQTPAPTPVANNGAEVKDGENTEGMEVPEQPRWRRKTPGLKVNRKLKRLRMNQRLRRTLQPKNAIMVLNEMKTGVQFTFPETQSSLTNSLFLVHAEIDGKTYVGQGLSKPLARQNAAENALKCLLLEKMTAASLKARMDAESDGVQNQSLVDSSSQNDENSEAGEKMETNSEEPDEIPWSSLASFALYKLFLEWQNQGTVVPVPRPGLSPGRAKKETKTTVQKELPTNALSVHPVMLLNQMRPGLTYVEVNRIGNPPNTMFTLGVEIDGVEYTGTAKNKKDAKKITAKAALQALFGLTYPEEVKVDHSDDIQMS